MSERHAILILTQGGMGCACWVKYSMEFKRKGGQRLYECKYGCVKCSLHCKHAKKNAKPQRLAL